MTAFTAARRVFCLMMAILLVSAAAACAEGAFDWGVDVLTCTRVDGCAGGAAVPLYAGPTSQFQRIPDAEIDTAQPFLFFGQSDCWAMVGLGSPEAPETVGWIEAAAAQLPDQPELLFEDALPLTLPEDILLSSAPSPSGAAADLPAGTSAVLLARFGEWGYLQAEPEASPIRGFAPLEALR